MYISTGALALTPAPEVSKTARCFDSRDAV